MSSFYSFYNISIKKQENNSLLWFNILPFVTIPLNLLTISLFFQQSLRKIPVSRTPCIPFSPHSPEFSPLSKQNHFSLTFVHYAFPKISFPSENLCRWPNLWLGTECSRSCPVLNLSMDCKDQGLRLVFLFLLVRVRVLFFFLLWVKSFVFEEIKVMGCDACWQGADSLKVG